ncbi:MAG: ABC transporter permease [Phycisphaerae bacterium]
MSPALSLTTREMVRFLRQRNRVIGALLTPVVFWLLIGTGVGDSFRAPGAEEIGYTRFFFPGTVLMIVLFTAIFSTISLIEDRREGFLQSVLISPAGRSAVVGGKVLGATLLAAGQAVLFLVLAPAVGFIPSFVGLLVALVLIVLVSFALAAVGFCVAWPSSSTAGFHAIMNLVLMPAWFLSGALFPLREGMFGPMKWVMLANPLTYALSGIRWGLSGEHLSDAEPHLAVSFVVTTLFAVACLAVAYLVAGRRVQA